MGDAGIITFIIQIILVAILFYCMVNLFKLSRVMKLEKRIEKYSINSISTSNVSFFDELFSLVKRYKLHFINKLKRKKTFVKMSIRYNKIASSNGDDPMDYIAIKLILSFLFLFTVIVSNAFWNRLGTIYEAILSILIGFYVFDIYLFYKERKKKKNIENDLLKAITIMNNSFKSGKSIMQAINIVSKEVDGELKQEFNKMYLDLTYGLNIDVVFKRFSKRVNIEEVKYLTTSLTILNKTGGNIVDVFSSIEKSFFRRKKIKQEMKSISASASFMFRLLSFIPLVIILSIILLNPTYFNPLFESTLGFIIVLIILLIYLTYIFVVKKIMKVEGL